jgi:hypothetical protein
MRTRRLLIGSALLDLQGGVSSVTPSQQAVRALHRSAVARPPDDGPFVNLGTEPQRARQRDQKPRDHSGEPKECVDHGCLHEVECYTRDGVLRVLDRRPRCVAGATGARSPERIAGWAVFVGLKRSEKRAMKLAAIGLATGACRRNGICDGWWCWCQWWVSDRPTPMVRRWCDRGHRPMAAMTLGIALVKGQRPPTGFSGADRPGGRA